MRKRAFLARRFAASSRPIVKAGVGAAGDRVAGGSATGGDEAKGGGEEASWGRVTGGCKRTDRGATRITTGRAT